MPLARYRLVDVKTTPYYHCVSRCVRRAFLCGIDRVSEKNFDHRKMWILERIKLLSSVFTIDVCAYAIMSNHFHLVLHVDSSAAEQMGFDEVLDRWLTLYKGPVSAVKYKAGESLSELEQTALNNWVEGRRSRLADLSWYMRCLNETIARMANAEDECKGRFWEGRFRSQALLDEAALISCMVYVDLNPIRAGLCKTLEASLFTSIEERLKQQPLNYRNTAFASKFWLKSFNQEGAIQSKLDLPLAISDYFALVDWTGRAIREDKYGAIPMNVQPILHRLGVKQSNWVNNTRHFGSRFRRAMGNISKIRQLAHRTNQHWVHGITQAQAFYL